MVLRSGIEVVASGNTVDKALTIVGDLRPDFLNMVVRLLGRDGISGATEKFERFGIRPIFDSAYKDQQSELALRTPSAVA